MKSHRFARAAMPAFCAAALICTWGPKLSADTRSQSKCEVIKVWDEQTCSWKPQCCSSSCGYSGGMCTDCCANDMYLGDCVTDKYCATSPGDVCEVNDCDTVCLRWTYLVPTSGAFSGSAYCNCTPDPQNPVPCSPECVVEAEVESTGYQMKYIECSGSGG